MYSSSMWQPMPYPQLVNVTSSLFTISSSRYAFGFNHGFASIPSNIRWVIKCINNDATSGWNAGDEFDYKALGYAWGTARPSACNYSANTLSISMSVETPSYLFSKNGNGLGTTWTSLSNFNLKCYYSL